MRASLHILRGLRFRLTVIYVLLFGVLLAGIGLYYRSYLQKELEREVSDTLDEEWDEAKGYLDIKNFAPVWNLNPDDPEDNYVQQRLQHVMLLTDAKGNILIDSATYDSIGVDPPEEIGRILSLKEPQTKKRFDSDGVPYWVKAGNMPGDRKEPYFLAIGRSLEGSVTTVQHFTKEYFVALPVILVLTSLLGWILAGPAIRPVNDVALAAQNITGSNLSLQIPARGAGDELDNLIESFNRMTLRLNESFDQIRRFSTDVSHELRTPLTAIRGQLEVALFTGETMEQYHEAMINALEGVEQLSSIVRALLLLSQAESGQLVLQKAPLDLGDVAEDVVDQFQIPAEEKQLMLKARIEHGVVAMADRTQIERFFSNLLSNAVKYTPAGGSVNVTLRRDEGNWARIEIQDTGVGIPQENLPHIFDRFYRVRNQHTNSIQGLGLGLSFVSWIVKAHGGSIDVTSRVGEGTCFITKLPVEVPAAPYLTDEPASAAEPWR
jgi:heavy metal sensor kinase